MAGMIDTMTNLIANIAIGKSKTTADQFGVPELNDTQLDAMYRGDWMARKIVNVPVADIMRPWRSWQASAANITTIEAAEKRHGIKAKIGLAMRAARLYGGAGIVVGADTARPDSELNIDAIPKGGIKSLTVLPRRLLQSRDIERDIYSSNFGKPKFYTMKSAAGGTIDIHPSRVLRFTGADRLDFEMNVEWWADSTLLAIYDAIHHAALTQAGIAELIHEAKIDVINIKNLASALSTTAGTAQMSARFTNANTLKSINNMLLLDEGETYTRKQTSFSGLPDVLNAYLQIVAGASDIPATRLLGTQAKGLGATGEGDLTNYYDALAGYREENLTPIMDVLDRALWRDAMGSVPTDAYASWSPLWQMTDKEKAEVASKKASTTKIYSDMGILPDDVLARGIANQLIEDEVYPGIEDELAKIQSAQAGYGEDPATPIGSAPGKPIKGG